MTKKQNKILTRIAVFASVILMSLSIFIITIYKRVLDEDLYIEALNQSQIYVIVADIIERNISESIIAWEKGMVDNLIPEQDENNLLVNSIRSFIFDTIIEKQTSNVVSNVFDKIGLEKVFQNVTEKTINTDLQWLKGEKEAHEIFGYIPTPKQIEKMKEGNFTQILLNNIIQNTFRTNNLPQCKNTQEINMNIALITNGNIDEMTCTTEEIDVVAQKMMEESGVKTIVEKVGTGAEELTKNSNVDGLLTDIYNISYAIAQIKQIAIDTRHDIQGILKWSYFTFFLSIIFGGFAVYLKKPEKRIMQVTVILFSSGVILISLSLLHYILFSKLLLEVIPFENIALGTNVLTGAEAILLTNSIKFIIEYIITGIVKLSFVIGVWIIIFSGTIYGGLKIFENRNNLQKKIKDLRNKWIKNN